MSPTADLRRRSLLTLTSFLIVAVLAASVGVALVSSATTTPTTAILANRIQVPSGTERSFLLRLPSLGYLYVDCLNHPYDSTLRIYWKNSESYSIDAWDGFGETQLPVAKPPSTVLLLGELRSPGALRVAGFLDLGRGVSPNPRRTAHVEVSVARSAANAPCLVHAMATSWSSQ
jgi:hypothetical protein